ncbi:hypothetical protein FKN01_31270 [Streptomyces sp. 130]|uniref:hypothetical protein n=1 Tax=Streptomyces sp. 130 TaxID=2591006 RepID=UPI00117F578B|nr:hypothetical protein [Streptomyces sp. 130]TRV71767.1 hypothetical protein FKN01_31270 [Streptomyces sp. 130]
MAIDNGAVDTLRSMTAKGLLSTLLRARDGDEVTVEALSKTHDEGRESLAKAMRALVDNAFVVKFKVQRLRSEVVELADGSTAQKRGGSWYTTFSVDSIAFTVDDVAVMLNDVLAGGNVKAVRVEPAHLDPREAAKRPATGKPYVGPTCEDTEESQVGPTYGKPMSGQPTSGRSAAKKIKTGEEEDSLSDARDVCDEPRQEREAATPEDNPAGAGVPGPREGADDRAALTMLTDLPGTVPEAAARKLVPLVRTAVAAGWTMSGLRAHLARLCDPERVRYAPAVYEKHLRELPAAPATGAAHDVGRTVPPGMCERHPAYPEGDCSRCRREEMDRLGRGRSEAGPIDGMGLLARVRAGQAAGGAR